MNSERRLRRSCWTASAASAHDSDGLSFRRGSLSAAHRLAIGCANPFRIRRAAPSRTLPSSDMQIPKPTAADKARFESLVPSDTRVAVKPMFGNLGAFVNDNMFMGLFGTDIGVKLDAAGQADLSAAGGGPFGPAERPMGGYVSLPTALSDDQAKTWIARSLAYVAALPPKKTKK